MIQDIEPLRLRNEFKISTPRQTDYVLIYRDNEILLKKGEQPLFPTFADLFIKDNSTVRDAVYLFEIDGNAFYLLQDPTDSIYENDGFELYNMQLLRTFEPMWLAFAGITGKQLFHFYNDNQFCGRCGKKMDKHKVERAMQCNSCNNIVYPKISPAIMVGITNGDKILLTKYSKGIYKRYGLVAGFVEIGETLEQTIEREVMEEVGLKVKNIRYHKNQPWAFSSSLLVGFYADLDGTDVVTLDQNELSEAVWLSREEIPDNPIKISLANEMIEMFSKGLEPK